MTGNYSMDWKEIVVGLLGIGLPALGWMLRTVWEDLREHQRICKTTSCMWPTTTSNARRWMTFGRPSKKQFERIHERLDDYFGVRKP